MPISRQRIPLTQKQHAVVDCEDFDRISAHKWYASWNPKTESFYAYRNLPLGNGKRTSQKMHRVVMGLESGGSQIDHVNRDTLDNRKSNLCIVTNRQNGENRRDQSKHGVGVMKKGFRFQVHVAISGRRIYVGTYGSPAEARQARVDYLEKYSSST